MRGDRPFAGIEALDGQLATPHARGSTSEELLSHLLDAGYPACAGIDPTRTGLQAEIERLPRMRGDRPSSGSPALTLATATPHARGSTRQRACGTEVHWGYPACAGIDLAIHAVVADIPGLPRMRGDRPRHTSGRKGQAWATPHARGSTCGLRHLLRC